MSWRYLRQARPDLRCKLVGFRVRLTSSTLQSMPGAQVLLASALGWMAAVAAAPSSFMLVPVSGSTSVSEILYIYYWWHPTVWGGMLEPGTDSVSKLDGRETLAFPADGPCPVGQWFSRWNEMEFACNAVPSESKWEPQGDYCRSFYSTSM